jgi:hypothetical protein
VKLKLIGNCIRRECKRGRGHGRGRSYGRGEFCVSCDLSHLNFKLFHTPASSLWRR